MYEKRLRQGEHVRRFAIRETGGAWEVRAEHDSEVVKRARYDDWHRVERMMLVFATEVASLEQGGWVPD
jgi:hypothetical protein